MDYNTKKYSQILYDVEKISYEKKFKSKHLFYILKSLYDLSFYNKFYDQTTDLSTFLNVYKNFLMPIIVSDNKKMIEGSYIDFSPHDIINSLDSEDHIIKISPNKKYRCIGIFIPYNQTLINYRGDLKPVKIDFSTGLNHPVKIKYSPVLLEALETKKKPPKNVVKSMDLKNEEEEKKQDEEEKKQDEKGARIFIVKYPILSELINKCKQVLSTLEIRNISSKQRFPIIQKGNIPVSNESFLDSDIVSIPSNLSKIAESISARRFSNIDDLYLFVFGNTLSTTQFYEKVFKTKKQKIVSVTKDINHDFKKFFKDKLFKMRKEIAKTKEELEEMYRNDERAKDPEFQKLNRYISAIQQKNIKFLQEYAEVYNKFLCQHYKDTRDMILEEQEELSIQSTIIERYGNTENSNGTYCNLCGELISMNINFLDDSPSSSSLEDSGVMGSLPVDDITKAYYADIYKIVGVYVSINTNPQIFVNNLLKTIYPIISEYLRNKTSYNNETIEIIVCIFILNSLTSLSILQPEIVQYKSLAGKDMTGVEVKKLYMNEAKIILKTLKDSFVKNSAFTTINYYYFFMENELSTLVDDHFRKLSSNNAFSNNDSDTSLSFDIKQLEGYNIYYGLKLMDRLSDKENNFYMKKASQNILEEKDLLDGIYPPDELDSGIDSSIFNKDGSFKHKTIEYLILNNVKKGKNESLYEKQQLAFKIIAQFGLNNNKTLLTDKNPYKYFCIDFSEHILDEQGKCLRCSYTKKVSESDVFYQSEFERLLEFYNLYSKTCPELSIKKQNGLHEYNSTNKKQNDSDSTNKKNPSSLECIHCGYSPNELDRIKYFKKYEKKLMNYETDIIIHEEEKKEYPVIHTKTKFAYNKSFTRNFDSYLTQVMQEFNIKTRERALNIGLYKIRNININLPEYEKEENKPIQVQNINSFLMSYFGYNGALYYYDISIDEKLKYAQTLLFEKMIINREKAKALLKDQNLYLSKNILDDMIDIELDADVHDEIIDEIIDEEEFDDIADTE